MYLSLPTRMIGWPRWGHGRSIGDWRRDRLDGDGELA